jgi:hypothetical protein
LFVGGAVLLSRGAGAQVVNPGFVEFLPPPEHAQVLQTGQPVVSSYQIDVYPSGSNDSVMSVPIGKPAPQADGLIRVSLAALVADWPLPDETAALRISARGPNGIGVSSPSNAFVVSSAPTAAATRLGDITWTSMVNGWGPAERNRSNGENAAGDGRTLTLAGRTYASGLGVHAGSTIRYALDGTCTTFAADIGVDDEIPLQGSVVFQVWANGTRLYQSPILGATSATVPISVNLTGRTELILTVTDAGDGPGSDHADWADARLTCAKPLGTATATARFLSDGPWTSVKNGWGPAEADRSNGELGAHDGRTLMLAGKTYAKGLGVHAASEVRYPLNGQCTRFTASVGVDDEVGSNGSVVFQVLADGLRLFDSGVLTGASATRQVEVDVSGRNELRLLVTDAGNGPGSDHADWADAQVTCNGGL